MTGEWPKDGSQPWISGRAGRVRIEWADHIYSLDRWMALRLINVILAAYQAAYGEPPVPVAGEEK